MALDGERYNRQLHQREIEWINKSAKDFALTAGISLENAKKLLTTAALSLVDAQSNLGINMHLLTDKGFTKAQLKYAQDYLLKNSKGLTFKNSFQNNREEQLFTTHNIVEYTMPYDPNKKPGAQVVKMSAQAALAGSGGLIPDFEKISPKTIKF